MRQTGYVNARAALKITAAGFVKHRIVLTAALFAQAVKNVKTKFVSVLRANRLKKAEPVLNVRPVVNAAMAKNVSVTIANW